MSEYNNFTYNIDSVYEETLNDWSEVVYNYALEQLPSDMREQTSIVQNVYESQPKFKTPNQSLINNVVTKIFNKIDELLTGSVIITIPNQITGVTYDGFSITENRGDVTGYISFNQIIS